MPHTLIGRYIFEETMSSSLTLNGTKIVDGIEYNEYPAPNMLVKAMEYQWAQQLVNKGELRLCPLSFYQALESDELGDRLEGQGELRINSHPYSLTSLYENFIWCCSNPDSQYSTLLGLDDRYDVVIKVLNTVEFVKRIANALREKGYIFSTPQVGRVIYNRASEITLDSLQNQKWQWNVFQKSPSFQHQNEYRFVFSALSSELPQGEAICLSIGNCGDIIELVKI